MPFDHETYLSPFSWRYGSQPMRDLWSELNRRRLMRRVWVALASAQEGAGLVATEQLEELREQMDNVMMERSLEIEEEIHHDVMAELRAYADLCPTGGSALHLGATSADITDNVDILRIRGAIDLLTRSLSMLLSRIAFLIDDTALLPVMGFTHIQPAEPTTLGYRLSFYAQDLHENLSALKQMRNNLRGKGFKGAVGTQASFQVLLEGSGISPVEMERRAMAALNLPYFLITSQTYPRSQDLRVINELAVMAATLHKFALDLRILQSPPFGEWSEPFSSQQVGSSAMPFKRNPINAENICSLARYIEALPSVAWSNASQAVLERSLDDSANRRIVFPEAFLAADELLIRGIKLLDGLVFDRRAIADNLGKYGPFSATERLLMALAKSGADRLEAHEWIRMASMKAWKALEAGGENPLVEILSVDPDVNRYLPPENVRRLLSIQEYTGTAGTRATDFARELHQQLDKYVEDLPSEHF